MADQDHGGIKSEGWEERYKDPDDKNSTAENTYAYVRRYNDGTVIVDYYLRGGTGVKRHEETTDPAQQKAYADQQKQASAAAQESFSAPPSQEWIPRTGPKDAAHPDGIYWIKNPNYAPSTTGANAPGKKTEAVRGDGGNTDIVTWEILPDGSKGRILEQHPATQAELTALQGTDAKPPQERVNPADPTKRQVWHPDANGGKGAWEDAGGVYQKPEGPPQERVDPANPGRRQVWKDGQWQDAGEVYQKPEKPTLVDLPTGGKGQLVPDPDNPGQFKAVPVPGTSGPQGQPTDFGELKFEAGNIAAQLTDAFTKANAQRLRNVAGGMTDKQAADQMEAELKPIFDLGNSRINEINGILGTQRGIYGDESANFRQRTQAASSIFTNVMGQRNPGAGHLAPSGESLLGQLALGLQYQNMFAPQPTMGVGLQQAKNLGINGVTIDLNSGQIHVGGGAGGGVQGSSASPTAPDISNPLALGMASDGVKQHARDMTTQQILNDPWFSPIADQYVRGTAEMLPAGMNVSGGQLRASVLGPAPEPETVGAY